MPGDAIVRPFIAARCDGDTVPIHRPVSRAMQLGSAVRVIDPVVGSSCAAGPFTRPFAVGHEVDAQGVADGAGVRSVGVGDIDAAPGAAAGETGGPYVRGL